MTDHTPTADGGYLRELLAIDFTDEQMAVITAPLSPQLVVAGAGSGKTMVMAARVVHAAAFHQLAPSRILGLTFTNKAAGELADRVRRCLDQLPSPARDNVAGPDEPGYDELPTIATYHSYAAALVRDHALRIGREPGATLLSEAMQWQLAMRVAMRAPGPFAHLAWTTPWVANLIILLAGDMADHLATAVEVRRHDQRIRDEVGSAAKVCAEAKAMVERSLARDELLALVAAYAAEKQRLDVIDFGDQVALACEIALASPVVPALERSRFDLVVLDEYQDTGVSQRVLLSRLFGAAHSVTAVGDANQSIYGWRGASVSNLSRFAEHFGGADSALPLMTSFRCDGRILEVANAVAARLGEDVPDHRASRIEIPPLRARPGAEAAGEVLVARCETAEDEATLVAERIRDALDTAAAHPGGIAVLARRRADFPRLHRAMVVRNIPVEVVGLGGLLAMPEVSDVVATLTLLVDATANASAIRLLTGPRWRIGVRDLAALGDRAAYLARERPVDPESGEEADDGESNFAMPVADTLPVSNGLDKTLNEATASVDPVEVASLLEAAESPGKASRCSSQALARLREFVEELRQLRGLTGQPIVDLITEIITTTGLDIEIEAGDPALAVARMANLHAFCDVAAHFTGLEGETDLAAFLAFLRAAADNEDGLDIATVSDTDTVKLMTVHAAKGLEWDIVAVPGLVEKVFPSERTRSPWTTGAQVLPFECRGDGTDLPQLAGYAKSDFDAFKKACQADSAAEERRLAYVAMTRAKHRLWLSGYVWSATRKDPMTASPYLEDARSLAGSAVEVTEWAEDHMKGDPNPLLVDGVADVPWPSLPDPDDLARRRAAAAAVEAARGQLELSTQLSGEAEQTVQLWRRDAGLLLDEARRRRLRTIDVAVPARLTTSQIVALAKDEDGFARSLARPMPSRPQPQARRGSRFHSWVEQLYGASPLLEPDDLPGAEDEDLSDVDLAALQQRFLADGWGERRPVRVEAPFEMVIGNRLIRGRIDAVYPRDDGGYDVIDYKTGAVPTGAEFEAASLQLSIYRLAWADLAGVAAEQVTAGFLYVRDGLLKRPHRLLSRDELRLLLDGARH